MSIDSTLEIEQQLELEDGELSDSEVFDKKNIFTESSDPSIESLHSRSKKGRLLIQPEYQRKYVWDDLKASKLIESILLNIPLPVIYIAEEADGKSVVIDGQQRLTSPFSFIDGHLNGDRFKLKGLSVLTELNGKTYSELAQEVQTKIDEFPIRVITIKKESDPNLKFEIFVRLNEKATPLNHQELRNCIFRGKYNDLLKKLADDPDFRSLLPFDNKRMVDVELVLRFAAFYHRSYHNYKAPIKNFLNREMEDNRDINSNKEEELKVAFKNSITIIRSLLGENAFKRFYSGDEKHPNGYWEESRINISLYDILMWSFANKDKNQIMRNLDSIREGLVDLMTRDRDFIDSIEKATSKKDAVKTRFKKWDDVLDEILKHDQIQERCFSKNLKKQFFDSNPVCSICSQEIVDIDDSAVDHIEQYWVGGKTIPSNARLTHRYCNNTRKRKE